MFNRILAAANIAALITLFGLILTMPNLAPVRAMLAHVFTFGAV